MSTNTSMPYGDMTARAPDYFDLAREFGGKILSRANACQCALASLVSFTTDQVVLAVPQP